MHVSCFPSLHIFDDPAKPCNLSSYPIQSDFGKTNRLVNKNIVSGQSEHALYVYYFPEILEKSSNCQSARNKMLLIAFSTAQIVLITCILRSVLPSRNRHRYVIRESYWAGECSVAVQSFTPTGFGNVLYLFRPMFWSIKVPHSVL